jgi:DNA-binding IclR family transcriptional regulator
MGRHDQRVSGLGEKTVKSAARALEVLEYFDEIRSAASVMDVARTLHYPQSSTTELLKSLAQMGYLSYDPQQRRYLPTHRVALLGKWIQAPHLAEGRVTQMMEELGEITHETIILAEQSSTIVRYIYVVPSRKAMRLHVGPGTIRPIARSGIGRLFLSAMPPERVQQLLRRINASAAPDEPIINYATLKPELEMIARQGYYVLLAGVTPGSGIVTMMLPKTEGYPELALGIGGFADGIAANADKLVDAMRRSIKRYLLS